MFVLVSWRMGRESGVKAGKELYQSKHFDELMQLRTAQEEFRVIQQKEDKDRFPQVGGEAAVSLASFTKTHPTTVARDDDTEAIGVAPERGRRISGDDETSN